MKRAKRLKPVVDIAAQQEEQASMNLNLALHELKLYREDYLSQALNNTSGYYINNTCNFVMQLDKAIKLQDEKIVSLNGAVDEYHDLWQDKAKHKKTLETLVEKFEAEEYKLESKREQKVQDEHAQNMWRRREP